MKKIYKNFILFINRISKKILIIESSVDIPMCVSTITLNKYENKILESNLLKSMRNVSLEYMDWGLDEDCSENDIIEELKKIDTDKRVSFWILLAAEINLSCSKNNLQLEHAIIETHKKFSFLKKN